MTLEMAQYLIEPFLMNGKELLVTFMGGETLLAISVIRDLIEWVEKNYSNSPVTFFGSTNGTLLNEELKLWLYEHRKRISLGLSYDGLPNIQKLNRGNNAIDIDYFISTWKQQPIQMTINEASVNKMANGIIYLLEKGAEVHPNVAFEKGEWSDENIREYGRQLNKLIYYYKYHPDKPIINQFVHDLNTYADSIENHQHQVEICGAGNGFQVFDVDGISYPCHILSPLVLRGEKLKEVQKGLLANTTDFSDSNCSSCPYTSSCPTCIACNYVYRCKLQKRDKTHCKIMQLEVKAFIKKEVMRLKDKKELTPQDATEIESIIKLVKYNQNK